MSKPKVVVYSMASLDGRLALSPDVPTLYAYDRWQAVTGTGSFQVDKWLHANCQPQAVLEGSGSFVPPHAEPEPLPPFEGDPAPLYEDFMPEAVLNRPGHRGWFVSVDSRGRVRGWIKEWPDPEWAGWHIFVLVARQTPPAYLAYLRREAIPYLVAGEERVDLRLALEKMSSQLGVTCLLSSAGGRLNGALLRAGLVDEVNVEFFPAIIGGLDTPSLYDSPDLGLDDWPTPLKLISAQVGVEGRVWLRYKVLGEEGQS